MFFGTGDFCLSGSKKVLEKDSNLYDALLRIDFDFAISF